MAYCQSINFTISVYLDKFEQLYVETLKSNVEDVLKWCDINEVTFEEVSRNPENAINVASVRECFLLQREYAGTVKNVDCQSANEVYQDFHRKWNIFLPRIMPDSINRPWLTFLNNDAFARKFQNAHKNVILTKLNFGTLASSSHFTSHFEQNCCNTNFLHDSRKIVVDNQMVICYSSIKYILVNGKEWILYLLHPPITYDTNKGIKYRTLTVYNLDPSLLGLCNAIRFEFRLELDSREVLSRLHYSCRNLSLRISFASFSSSHLTIQARLPTFDFGSFETNYLVEAILRRSKVLEVQNFRIFENLLWELIDISSDNLNKSLKELIYLTESGFIFSHAFILKFLFEQSQKSRRLMDVNDIIPKKTKLVRRAMITPSKILLWPPELVITNRVLRKFDIDCSIRVSFRDVDGSKLSCSRANINCQVVISSCVNSLQHGLLFGNQKYEFLAWSNSQIRDHGLWMYSRDSEGNTAFTIREWMGDFSSIRCVPKFAARMGQCFSQTEETVMVPLTEGTVKLEDDIISIAIDPESNEPYCFSDGIGRISKHLAEKVCKSLYGVKRLRSAYQIRYSGYKGMLVIDPTLEGHDIVFRQSMKKFDCPKSQTLEIVKIAQPCGVTLNRPLVTIMDQMGIDHAALLKLQCETLQSLTEMFLDDAQAISFLSMHHNFTNVHFDQFVLTGIYPTIEPFFRSMLLAGHKFDVAQILRKARLPIDQSLGRNMFGVLDETKTLKYGEVFVQYTEHIEGHETNTKKAILRGKVLVTKNPCYQPGDVRVLKAVDVLSLHHVVDCIVFPQQGRRPHPNEMSGSDLDGDEYTVIWSDRLIFKKPNGRTRDFPVPEKTNISRDISMEDLLNFFSSFIVNDKIGVLASAHLALADCNKDGLHSSACRSLARKCSIAVDYAKNGQVVNSDVYTKVKRYPDFMEKWDKISYQSERALGKLYRNCRSFARLNPPISGYYKNVQVDPLLVDPGWENYKASALVSLGKYNSFLESILTNYGVVNESEAMTGMYSRVHDRFGTKNGRTEIEELVKILIQSLWETLRQDFYEEFVHSEQDNREEKIYQKASAWYLVTYLQPNPVYLSMPWIVSQHLLEIKQMKQIEMRIVPHPKPIIKELEVVVELELKKLHRLPSADDENYVLKKAEQLLQLWAEYNQFDYVELSKLFMAQSLNDNIFAESLLYIFEFFKLIMRVSMLENSEISKFQNSAGCLLVPETVKEIGKEAMCAYQHVAVTKSLASFGLGQKAGLKDLVEMDPKSIPHEVLGGSSLLYLNSFFVRNSGVECVDSSIENGVILLSALGTADKIEKLEGLIRQDTVFLQKALRNGFI